MRIDFVTIFPRMFDSFMAEGVIARGIKQGLLDMRSENARMRLVTRLFRAAIKRLEMAERVQERAQSNGKVRFG